MTKNDLAKTFDPTAAHDAANEDDAFRMLAMQNAIRESAIDLSSPVKVITYEEGRLEYNKTHPRISTYSHDFSR